MKTTKFLIVAMLMLLSAGVKAKDRVVELPPAVFSNTRSVEIGKVTLSDTATVLDIAAFYRPGWWIKIASDSYLLADGKKYMIRSGEGIDLDSLFGCLHRVKLPLNSFSNRCHLAPLPLIL